MFVWLASYPKSGNTMVRSLLATYFFSNDGIFNFDLIKNIKQFPNIKLFENFGVDISDDDQIIKNYIKVQNTFCDKNSVQFLKTHSYLFNFYNKYSFTNLNNSIGAIYIVRDPRNIVTSFSKFANISDEEATKKMINEIYFGGDVNSENIADRTKVWTGTWAQNFNSWKSFTYQERYLLIKYEDLIENTEKMFLKILEFVHKLENKKFTINDNKFKNTIKTVSFRNMQDLEKKIGFHESKIDKKSGKKIPFFNLGPENDWKKYLDLNLRKKIETAFEKEMLELGYL
tara:strand:- start:206 stop:1063 length:858 start_codon:yes stop_codon:yes gene_type:complete